MQRRATYLSIGWLSVLHACGSVGSASSDGGVDATVDASADVGLDATHDGSTDADPADATMDAVVDAGPCPGLDPSVDLDTNGVADCMETLVANAQLATNASGWRAPPSSSHSWSTADGVGNPSSGSLAVSNEVFSNVAGLVTQTSAQCIPVTPGETYEGFVQVYIPSGQGPMVNRPGIPGGSEC